MRRCTYCFRFHPGRPTYCDHCGRSFGVRLCSRGHASPRGATYCAECGSADLSTPAPPASILHHVSGLVLYLFGGFVVITIVLVIVMATLRTVDWSQLGGPLVELVLMLGFLYWTTTLLPGPIKKVGKALGHALVKSMTGKRKH